MHALHHTLFGGLVLMLAGAAASAAPVNGQGTWETTLLARDLDGDPNTIEAYFDTTLEITWLADANAAGTQGFGSNGLMDWQAAVSWIDGLNSSQYLGIDQWRLPTLMDTGVPGCDLAFFGTDCGYNVLTADGTTTYSEMASMFYDTLANIAFRDTAGGANQPGWGLSNTGPFANLQASVYWSGLDGVNSGEAWFTSMSGGRQDLAPKSDLKYAWAVVSGDVAAVPLPPAMALFAGGLLALGGLAGGRGRHWRARIGRGVSPG